MATVTTMKSAPVRINLPKNPTELSVMLGALGGDVRELIELDVIVAGEIAKIKERYASSREALKKAIGKRAEKITDYTHAHRHELLPEDGKTVELEGGSISFYFGPTAVVCEDDEVVIEYCKNEELVDALRVTTTLDREWIEKNRDTVAIVGITFEQTEFAKIVPSGLSDESAIRRKVRVVAFEN